MRSGSNVSCNSAGTSNCRTTPNIRRSTRNNRRGFPNNLANVPLSGWTRTLSQQNSKLSFSQQNPHALRVVLGEGPQTAEVG